MKQIYLDHASTTPIDKQVLKAMNVCFEKIYGNPGSLHKQGYTAKEVLTNARQKVAKVLNCAPQEIIFTGSGTESDNLAILGVARANKQVGSSIICSSIEHHAVLNSVEHLKETGFETVLVEVDQNGVINLADLKNKITDQTVLVSVMYANNEIGTIQPVKEISKIIKETRLDRQKRGIKTLIYFHTDACQAAGYLELDVNSLGVDLLTLNGSKIYGPKGTGVLYVRTGVNIKPIIFGGGQEGGKRSGTENVPGIVGLAKALEISDKKRKIESKRETKLRDYFIKNIIKNITRVILNGHPENRLPNNINISVLDIEGEAMLLWLDKYGIAVSTGSACDSKSLEPSHVIMALGKSYEFANSNLRFTLGRSTTKKDIDYVLAVLPKIVQDLRKISPIKTEENAKYIK
jgi:cysteine desulfurase